MLRWSICMTKSLGRFRDDSAAVRDECVSFLRSEVSDTAAEGVVIGLRGDLDSTVAATLAVEALGPDRVYGLILPSSKIGSRSALDAEAIAEALGIDSETIHLQPLLMCVGDLAPVSTDLHADPFVRDNLVARLRMAMLYLAANATQRLVVGSTTRTELLLGSFVKHGDGATDIHPLGGLYRTEVELLAAELDVPSFVIESRPRVGVFPDRFGRHDPDIPFEAIDAVLCRLLEGDTDPESISTDLDADLDLETVERICRHYRTTRDEQRLPTIGPGPE